MPVKINFVNKPKGRVMFSSLKDGECFKIVGGTATYMKVNLRHPQSNAERYRMLELATGHVFPATHSPVDEVDVEINVNG